MPWPFMKTEAPCHSLPLSHSPGKTPNAVESYSPLCTPLSEPLNVAVEKQRHARSLTSMFRARRERQGLGLTIRLHSPGHTTPPPSGDLVSCPIRKVEARRRRFLHPPSVSSGPIFFLPLVTIDDHGKKRKN